MAPPAAAVLARVVASADQAAKCIVVATASVHDAARMARDFVMFERGRVVRVATEPPLRDTRATPRMRIVATNARALVAELAKKPEVEHLELSDHGVLAVGKDATALATAINGAIIASGTDVERIEAVLE
jgi:ABC-type uncharacterized transport system ATPase subunit